MDYIQSCLVNGNSIVRSSQIKPISYLKANAAEVLARLAERREPMSVVHRLRAKKNDS